MDGRPSIGYTEKQRDGSINVTLRSDFDRLYAGMPKSAAGRDYSGLSDRDERAAIIAHEGTHVNQFRRGMTASQYGKNRNIYERQAYRTGKLVNKAFGSVSIYDSLDN